MIESIHINQTAQNLCPCLPEIIHLTMNSMPSIMKASKDASEVEQKLVSLMQPYAEGGEFMVSFIDPTSKLPVDVKTASAASMVLDYKVKVH